VIQKMRGKERRGGNGRGKSEGERRRGKERRGSENGKIKENTFWNVAGLRIKGEK